MATASSPDLAALGQSIGVAGDSAFPQLISSQLGADAAWTTTFDPGHGTAALSSSQSLTTPILGELDLAVPSRQTVPIPGVVTQAFLAANSLSVGDTVAAAVGGGTLPVTVVAVVSTFPTVTAAEGGVIVDLASAGVTTVLASPSAAAIIGAGVGELTSRSGLGPLRVRVAGTAATTPAATGTGPFVIMPLEHLARETSPPAINLLLITGTGISHTALAAVVSKDVPAAAIGFRSAVLDGLVSSPLQAAADLIMRLSLAVAAGFGLAILLLGLALGSADRDLTLARLTTMGLEQERLIRLVLEETLLAVVAAVAAATACAVALPALTSSALNLSVFTGSSTPVPVAPDLVALAGPAAGLAVLTAVAVVAEARLLRHRDVPGLLRIGG